MSTKYEESYVREEEGSYHRREIEPIEPKQNYTHHETTYQTVEPTRHHSKAIRPKQAVVPSATSEDDDDNFEEWTTSKRKVNHKIRQVETRVSRQLLVEDGKVIADSGPQVTTRIKEDNRVEECEKEKLPKSKSKFNAIDCAPEVAGSNNPGRVLGEKKEVQKKTREIREENMQYHDERFKELSGHDVHKKALKAPHELITITDKSHHSASSAPKGQMVHYSNRGKKYQDVDEILEVAKLAIDGSITKEVKRTKHHEECSEDELPDEHGEAEQLRDAPTVTRSSRRHVDYVNDFDDTSTPPYSSDDEIVETGPKAIRKPGRARDKDERAFPRYGIDPLLNSLRDDDFRPKTNDSRRQKQVPLRRKEESSSENDQNWQSPGQNRHQRQRQRSPSPAFRSGSPVEIPEEYRVNKSRLLSKKGGSLSRERSFSPVANRSQLSQRSHRLHPKDQDASVQVQLTDEEDGRRSSCSSNIGRSREQGLQSLDHEKQTRHLQRQSTANSSRNYYFGQAKHQRQRAPSVTSSVSSSSLEDLKSKERKRGTKSRDSGFRSPHSYHRTETPISTGSGQKNQIYSVSNKSKHRAQDRSGAVSPSGSVGQRSVKTTTTTLAAGLADRPRSRSSAGEPMKTNSRKSPETNKAKVKQNYTTNYQTHQPHQPHQPTSRKQMAEECDRSLDTVSLSSLAATTIKVPYRKEMAEENGSDESEQRSSASRKIDRSRNKHYNYRTVIANVQPSPIVPRQQIIDSYNVRVIEHKTPFSDQIQPIKSMSDLSSSIARLEQLSNDLNSLKTVTTLTNQQNPQQFDNNNESNFNLREFMKDKAGPFPVYNNSSNNDNDNLSVVSSCSLKSSRTYDVRTQESTLKTNQNSEDEYDFPVECLKSQEQDYEQEEEEPEDENNLKAWIFDLRDNSSTAIKSRARAKKPDVPEIDAKTEVLAESRGGRSYYLELIEKAPAGKGEEDGSLRTRWSSYNALNSTRQPTIGQELAMRKLSHRQQPAKSAANNKATAKGAERPSLKPTDAASGLRKPQQLRASSMVRPSEQTNNRSTTDDGAPKRRQLPYSGLPLLAGNRSKSVSCLASSTRPSKYSIYGGFKKANSDNKPVPRLSYSRAIGPKSKRQIEIQTSKTPSRYLKMK